MVSEVLSQYDYETCSPIYDKIKGSFVKLSQNKYSSKFIEISIMNAPEHVQQEIFDEFCRASDLHKVVLSNFGNYVLQHSLEGQDGNPKLKVQMLRAIIECLGKVGDFKVQQKWGQEILVKHIKQLEEHNEDEMQEVLREELSEVMQEINDKHKVFKQQQMQQMREANEMYHGHSNHGHSNKAVYQKSSTRSGSNSQGQGYDRYDYHSQEGLSHHQYGQHPSSGSSYNYHNEPKGKRGKGQ